MNNNWFGAWNDTGWIIVYVIVALVVIGAIVMAGRRKKRQVDHLHAESMRLNARRNEPRLEQREAETRRLEAESDKARAEADRQEAVAREEREQFEREKAAHESSLREADRLDPHVTRTSRDGEADAAEPVADRAGDPAGPPEPADPAVADAPQHRGRPDRT
ncbi:MAG: hypothetical protein FWE71_04340 [Nocardioidaceae bacterium]|nr:hypothetical protein [Nocardioidaceae bacterium]